MNHFSNSKGISTLVVGDIVVYLFSLILTLTIRHGELPTRALLAIHITSFSILFVVFLVVSFAAGLYDKQSSFLRNNTRWLVIKTQVVNIFIGAAFFYLAPVGIAPKANLIIYFIISTALMLLWREIMFPVVSITKIDSAILIGDNDDIQDLYEEMSSNTRYGLSFKGKIVPQNSGEEFARSVKSIIQEKNVTVVVADLSNKAVESIMPFLYSIVFSGIQIIDAGKLYEVIFDRVPLSMIGERWLVENASASFGYRRAYDLAKRITDICVAVIVGIVSLIFYPFVWLAIKIEDKGPLFIIQKRIGKKGKNINIVKFRSMTANDGGSYGDSGKTNLKVTRVGKFIRLTRIDELPQLWNVLRGDISLVGPRTELPALVDVYEKEIPYYHARHLVKPGLSGWAQIYHKAHPHHAVAVHDTRDKLSYDLFYVKNRSLALDGKIALQTAKAILSRQGV